MFVYGEGEFVCTCMSANTNACMLLCACMYVNECVSA